jgi:hypothetical protein
MTDKSKGKTIPQCVQTVVNNCLSFFKRKQKYHWFEVRFRYGSKGINIFDFVCQIGVKNLQETLDRRALKKTIGNLKNRKGVGHFLKNGHLDVEIICYLGRFPK